MYKNKKNTEIQTNQRKIQSKIKNLENNHIDFYKIF